MCVCYKLTGPQKNTRVARQIYKNLKTTPTFQNLFDTYYLWIKTYRPEKNCIVQVKMASGQSVFPITLWWSDMREQWNQGRRKTFWLFSQLQTCNKLVDVLSRSHGKQSAQLHNWGSNKMFFSEPWQRNKTLSCLFDRLPSANYSHSMILQSDTTIDLSR